MDVSGNNVSLNITNEEDHTSEFLIERIDNIRNRSIVIIEELLMKYKTDDYFLSKFLHQIDNIETSILQQKREHQQRKLRKQELEFDKANFIENFFKHNNYLYFPDSEIFVEYTNFQYKIVTEDAIWSKIFSQISSERSLMPWKQKVRIEIVSHIKKFSMINHVPESETIQKIIDILKSTICKSKDQVKFLLTYIGDLMMKKNTDNYTIIANSKLNSFIDELNYFVNKYFKINIHSNIKFKYYNHKYSELYVLDCQENSHKKFLWYDMIKKHIIDLLCVSYYYSGRYENVENFLENCCSNEEFLENCCFLKRNTKEKIINDFSHKSFIYSSSLNITPEEVIFVWKDYLETKNLPNIMFQKDVIDTLKQELFYDASRNIFPNVISNKLDYIHEFCNFFKENFKHNEDKNELFEVDELVILFKERTHKNIDNEKINKILKHFFPNINQQNSKFISIYSECYNKKQMVKDFIEHSIERNLKNNYTDYVKYSKKQKKKLIVNKQYFEECKSLFL